MEKALKVAPGKEEPVILQSSRVVLKKLAYLKIQFTKAEDLMMEPFSFEPVKSHASK